ncbi:hypothetical protein SSP35_03_03400 [Streptomyces sp. NBRC 110611]|nr:hypothetical protein SSP35_03_03400 [Streptomyces sp. NBRC 110611]
MTTKADSRGSTRQELMSIDEVAAFLRKPKSWVYGNWRSEGIPFKKVGNQLRCRPAELDDWLDRQIP